MDCGARRHSPVDLAASRELAWKPPPGETPVGSRRDACSPRRRPIAVAVFNVAAQTLLSVPRGAAARARGRDAPGPAGETPALRLRAFGARFASFAGLLTSLDSRRRVARC